MFGSLRPKRASVAERPPGSTGVYHTNVSDPQHNCRRFCQGFARRRHNTQQNEKVRARMPVRRADQTGRISLRELTEKWWQEAVAYRRR
eukprot:scaffold125000_cov63-Phaeocystis_antarctica.AAC.3